ncbi:MAG: hypothetical protein BIP78_0722 [Candidatus Bipolaricaulis sibiricus]|uniref:Uncharacterized protein n=1 Tax=Bipolaricaulis sibiricus TaxID=2501609 RepID=A0A410FU52_BIPS1|nr:MAG: hypothetical protein BIP78_0722 [Candidatus Bipolaricaulis sibiricus]
MNRTLWWRGDFAELRTAMSRRNRDLEHVLWFLRAINRGVDLPELARTILEYALQCIPQAQSGTFLVLNDEEGVFEYCAAVGWDLDRLARIRIPREAIVQRQLVADRPAIVRDPRRLNRESLPPDVARALEEFPVAAFMTFPICADGEVIAYFNVDSRDDPDAFSPADLEKLDAVWEEITLAVRAARSHEQLAQSERLLRLLFERLADAVFIVALDGTILAANPAAERQTGYTGPELLQMNIRRDLAVGEPQIPHAEVNERLLRGEIVTLEEMRRRKDGSTFWVECHGALFEYRGQPAAVSVSRDISDRKRQENAQVARLTALEALVRAGPEITRSHDPREVVERIVAVAREIAGADHANVLLFAAGGEVAETFDPFGAPRIPVHVRKDGFSHWILQTGQFLVIDDIHPNGETVPAVVGAGQRTISASKVLVREGIRSLAGLPVIVGGERRAILYVHSRRPGALAPGLPALALLAAQAGVALENALLYRDLKDSEARYRALFEESPLPLWIEDFSAVEHRLEALRADGVSDLAALLQEDPHLARELVGLVRVVDVNRATLGMYRAEDAEQLRRRLPELIAEESSSLFVGEVLAMWERRTEFHGDGINVAADGARLHIHLVWRVLPGHERTYDRVLVTTLDITARVEAEREILRRDEVLGAVGLAAERFLRGGEIETDIPAVLARLGEAAGASRAYIFERHDDVEGLPQVSQRFEWVAPGIAPQIESPVLQSLRLVEAGFARWAEAFSRGEAIHGLVREFPPEEQAVLVAQGILSLVVVPIVVARRWWGFLGFDECCRECVWTQSEVEALQAAARALGAAIERAMLDRNLRSLNAELEGLYKLSIALGTTLDLSDLFGHIYDEVTRLVPCDAFTLALVDAPRGQFRLAFAVEEGVRLPELVLPLDPQRSLTAWIVSTKEPLLVRDFEAEKDRLPAVAQQVGKLVRSWLGVPLLFQDEVLGVLSVQSLSPGVYDADDLRLLRTVSAPVATAVRNARSYIRLAEMERRLRAVEDAARWMKLARNKPELYDIVLELADSVLGYRPCAILEPQDEHLVVIAGHEELAWARGLRVPIDGNGITVAAARSREGVYVPDVATDERYVHGNSGTRSELAIPITHGDRLLGVLDVQADRVDAIPPGDRDLLGIVASELAVALVGLERVARLESLTEKLAGLHEASRQLTRCTTEADVCRAAVEVMAEVLGFQHVIVGLGRGDLLVPTAWVGSVLSRPKTFRKGEGVAGKTWLTGESAWGNLDHFPEARPVDPRIEAFISVPIGSIGVIQVVSPVRDAYTAEDVSLVEILARHMFEEIRRVQLENELREQATRDPLTGLYNRRFLAETLARELERARRYGHPLTLILADIDDFKRVNDRYGHVAGDAALRCVADVLQTSVRAVDLVFRYGGEEFVVVLPETGSGGDALQRLQEKMAAVPVPDVPGLTLSVSLGHVTWDPSGDAVSTLEDLLHRADEVLYAIKGRRGGR